MRRASFFGTQALIEQLEDRQMLTAVVTITGSNTPTELLQVHLNKNGEVKVNRNGVWSTLHVGFDTILKVHSGTFTAKPTQSGVPSKGKHTIDVFANANIVKEVDVDGTQDSVNYINVNVFATGTHIKAFGGWRSQNYETSNVTNTTSDIWLFGGLQSKNFLTSIFGNTKMKGGDYSENFITGKKGNDQLIGGIFSSNYITVSAGNNTIFGGDNSQNVYNLNGGTGFVKSGGYSSNTVYTATGAKPSGYVFNTSNGAFVFRKAA